MLDATAGLEMLASIYFRHIVSQCQKELEQVCSNILKTSPGLREELGNKIQLLASYSRLRSRAKLKLALETSDLSVG